MFTTMEKLTNKVTCSYGSVMQFGDYVFVTDIHWQGGFVAEIYEFVDDPKEQEFGVIECRLSLIKTAKQHFEDGGHAIEWCLAQVKK